MLNRFYSKRAQHPNTFAATGIELLKVMTFVFYDITAREFSDVISVTVDLDNSFRLPKVAKDWPVFPRLHGDSHGLSRGHSRGQSSVLV